MEITVHWNPPADSSDGPTYTGCWKTNAGHFGHWSRLGWHRYRITIVEEGQHITLQETIFKEPITRLLNMYVIGTPHSKTVKIEDKPT